MLAGTMTDNLHRVTAAYPVRGSDLPVTSQLA